MIYKEYDIPRTEQIEEYMKMSDQEREALLKKLLEEDRKERKERNK